MKKNKIYLTLTIALVSTDASAYNNSTYKVETNSYIYNLKNILNKQDESFNNKIKFSDDIFINNNYRFTISQKPKFEYLKQFKNDESLFDNNIHLMINNYKNTNGNVSLRANNTIIINWEGKYKLSDNKKVSLGVYGGLSFEDYLDIIRGGGYFDIPAGIFIKGYHDYEKIKLNYGAMGYGIYQSSMLHNDESHNEYKALGLGFAGAEYQINDKISAEGYIISGFGISKYSEFNTNNNNIVLNDQPTAYSIPLYLELKTNYSLRDGIKFHGSYTIGLDELLKDSFSEVMGLSLHNISLGITVDF